MDDDRLAQELQRRADSAASRPDWVRRDLLPAVRHEIDARPQRVMTSNWSPRLGVAAVVAALLVLVIAVPRLTPQPPATNTTPPPTETTALSTAEFAERLASGDLNGRTVLVTGGIVAYDGPVRFGPFCAGAIRACLVGQLEGIDPRVEVVSRDIAVGSPAESSHDISPGWPWWTRVTPPIHGTLVLSVKGGGGVEFIGQVRQTGGSDLASVSAASSLDVNSLGRLDVVLVDGWLGGTPSDQVHCAEIPADQQIETRLPSRQCTDEWIAQAADASSALVQVQPGAYSGLAPNPSSGSAGSYEARQGLYALATRLEGWCQSGAPPCWQWNVVARVDPVSAAPTASPPPGPNTVLSTADFAAGVSSGALDGRVVLVAGKVSVPAAAPPFSFPCEPPDGVCGLGSLEGTDPPVYVDTSYKPTTDTPGSGTWAGGDGGRDYHFPSVPIEGVLALRVMTHNHAFFIGMAGHDGAAPVRSVAEAQAIDISTVTLDQVVLVDGWLGGFTETRCLALPVPTIDLLPERECSYETVTRDPHNEPGSPVIQVQRGAYAQFAPNPTVGTGNEPRKGLYALSPSLEGWCGADQPPCWLWNVVARLNGPPSAPTPTTPATIECTPSSGIPITLVDATGTVAGCRSLDMSWGDSGGTVLVSNRGDLSRLYVELSANRCIRGADAQFSVATSGYTLVITEGEAVPDCAGPLVSVGFELDLRTDIAASTVTATHTPQATASPSPSAVAFYCPPTWQNAPSDVPLKALHPTVVDMTGLVLGCDLPDKPMSDWTGTDVPRIGNPGGDTGLLQIEWTGDPCGAAMEFTLSRSGNAFGLEARSTYTGEFCIQPLVIHTIRLTLNGPIDASSVIFDWNSQAPDATPTPSQPIGTRTFACDGSEALGDPGITLIDHSGRIGGCSIAQATFIPDKPIEVTTTRLPLQLAATWTVNAGPGGRTAGVLGTDRPTHWSRRVRPPTGAPARCTIRAGNVR